MTIVFKLHSEKKGQHIHTTVFSGTEEGTFANCGTLIQNVGEWQFFGALLLLGARETKGRCVVQCEGDDAIIAAFQEEDQ